MPHRRLAAKIDRENGARPLRFSARVVDSGGMT
jgi:hypothetical protein